MCKIKKVGFFFGCKIYKIFASTDAVALTISYSLERALFFAKCSSSCKT